MQHGIWSCHAMSSPTLPQKQSIMKQDPTLTDAKESIYEGVINAFQFEFEFWVWVKSEKLIQLVYKNSPVRAEVV